MHEACLYGVACKNATKRDSFLHVLEMNEPQFTFQYEETPAKEYFTHQMQEGFRMSQWPFFVPYPLQPTLYVTADAFDSKEHPDYARFENSLDFYRFQLLQLREQPTLRAFWMLKGFSSTKHMLEKRLGLELAALEYQIQMAEKKELSKTVRYDLDKKHEYISQFILRKRKTLHDLAYNLVLSKAAIDDLLLESRLL